MLLCSSVYLTEERLLLLLLLICIYLLREQEENKRTVIFEGGCDRGETCCDRGVTLLRYALAPRQLSPKGFSDRFGQLQQGGLGPRIAGLAISVCVLVPISCYRPTSKETDSGVGHTNH
jgi:hypothetical protein